MAVRAPRVPPHAKVHGIDEAARQVSLTPCCLRKKSLHHTRKRSFVGCASPLPANRRAHNDARWMCSRASFGVNPPNRHSPPEALQEREASGLHGCGNHDPQTHTQTTSVVSASSTHHHQQHLSGEPGSPFGHPRLKGNEDGDGGHPHQGRGPQDAKQEHRAADGGEGRRPQVVEEHRALPQLGRVLRLSHSILRFSGWFVILSSDSCGWIHPTNFSLGVLSTPLLDAKHCMY